MAYVDKQPLSRKLANLGTAGAIELALGVALVTSLTITVVPKVEAPQIKATNIEKEVPPPPDSRPSAKPIDTVIDTVKPIIDVPTPDSATLVYPTPTVRDVGYDRGPDPTPMTKPSPRFTPTAAVPRNASSGWVTTDDYPRRELIAGHQGTTAFRVTVGTEGRVQNCQVTRSSGFPALDRAACERITRRARFDPATDETGAKVAGSYTGSVHWQIPD
jgi:protein TonB